MPPSTAKRLILYRFDRQPLDALGQADSYLQETHVAVLSREGVLQNVDYKEIKAICFVSDGAAPDLFTEQTTFERRPKLAGLWVSFRLRDGDVIEGVLAHNLTDWPKQGYLLTPPRANANRQRVFIPREAVAETVLRGVVGAVSAPAKSAKTSKAASARDAHEQLSMFD